MLWITKTWQTAFVRHDGSGIRIGTDKQDEYIRGVVFDLFAQSLCFGRLWHWTGRVFGRIIT